MHSISHFMRGSKGPDGLYNHEAVFAGELQLVFLALRRGVILRGIFQEENWVEWGGKCGICLRYCRKVHFLSVMSSLQNL